MNITWYFQTEEAVSIAGSVQYCRNYQIPVFEKNEFKSLEEV